MTSTSTESLPEISIFVEPGLIPETGEVSAIFTARFSEPAPSGGLTYNLVNETSIRFDEILIPPEQAENIESFIPVLDENGTVASATVTVPEGTTDTKLVLIPVPDDEVEGEETAVISLISGEGYRIDPDNDTVVLTINDLAVGPSQTTNGDDLVLGSDRQDRINGRRGNDEIIAQGGNDKVAGGRGDDLISGGEGHDQIRGGAGDDLLRGGLGKDRLYGNRGSDTFVLAIGEGKDIIQDFRPSQDFMGLTDGLNANSLGIHQVGRHTRITFEDEVLAVLKRVNADQLTSESFVAVTT